ncbi:hypothetical protein PcP3B5_22970 [Pseudomonas citronellolis]|nr:hypothetical protein PcP3B5_22970 [Pseudomonas citronellolis]
MPPGGLGGPCPRFARRARSYREWRGWGGVGGSHPRIAPRRPAIADKVRYGETPCLPADCRSGPCPRFARRARSYRGMAWVGQRRSGSHPRIAPEVPAIADKVRSYREMPCLTVDWAGPARDFARRARSYREWRGWGGVGGSHPRIAPRRPAIADKVRYGETPCLPADCRSGPCPRFRAQGAILQGMVWVGQRRSGSHPRIAPEVPAIADKVRSGETPCLPVDWAGPARDSRAGRAPTGNGMGGAA